MSEYTHQAVEVLEDFSESSALKKITIKDLPLETAKEGDKVVCIDLKDGRRFELFVKNDGRVTHLLQHLDRADGVVGDMTKWDQVKDRKEYYALLEELHDAILSAELPEKYDVVFAMKEGL